MSNNFVLRIFAFRVKTVDNETIAEYNLIATEKVAIKVCFFRLVRVLSDSAKTEPNQNKPNQTKTKQTARGVA